MLNLSNGGEGISGGVDQYGYLGRGIARYITDLVHHGEYIQKSKFNISSSKQAEKIVAALQRWMKS